MRLAIERVYAVSPIETPSSHGSLARICELNRSERTTAGAAGRPLCPLCSGGYLGCRADLLEESHRVEVVAALLDLAALEREQDGSGCLLKLARRRDRSFCGHKWAGVRARPGHFQGRLVAAGHGAGYRADGIRERRLPGLEELDDLLRTLDLPLSSKLVVEGVGR